MRHGRDSLPPAGRHAASATPAEPADLAAPASGRHSRHADPDAGAGADRPSRRLRAVPDLPEEPRRTPRLADILAATPAESPAPTGTRARALPDAPAGAGAVPAPRRAPEPRSTPAGPARLGDHPSLPGVPAIRPARPPQPAAPTGAVPPQVTAAPTAATRRDTPGPAPAPTAAPRTAATRTPADAPAPTPAPTTAVAGPDRPAAPAKRPAARRSDPSEIAARATTTLISSQPRAGRRRADRALVAPPAPGVADQDPVTPVFADGTGRRAKHWRLAAIAATAVCASYVGVVAVGAVAGPVGPTASPTLLPPPTLAPPAPAVAPPTVDARNVAEVEPTTTKRSARATTTTRATPRSTTPRVPRTTPRAVVVAPEVPAAQRQVQPRVAPAPVVAPDEPENDAVADDVAGA
ncbi:hypothetical protein [Actinomycetospora flava]|uniref:Meckel syndrome type 1 protein n=1 Tax=Actinomycetospora flava TaxID=3129232 RepID=A0ABU8M8X5_9PSEU